MIDEKDRAKHDDIIARTAFNTVNKWKSYAFGEPLDTVLKEAADKLEKEAEEENNILFGNDEVI